VASHNMHADLDRNLPPIAGSTAAYLVLQCRSPTRLGGWPRYCHVAVAANVHSPLATDMRRIAMQLQFAMPSPVPHVAQANNRSRRLW
jgi:hypothetical protein